MVSKNTSVLSVNSFFIPIESSPFLVSGLQDFFIDVSNNSDGSSAEQCAHDSKTFAPGETRVYECPCGIYGRYVRIRVDMTRRDNLRLCEVQVQAGGEQKPFPLQRVMSILLLGFVSRHRLAGLREARIGTITADSFWLLRVSQALLVPRAWSEKTKTLSHKTCLSKCQNCNVFVMLPKCYRT